MLPIHAHLEQILQHLADAPNVILEAQPGAGKSTVVPLAMLKAAWLGNKKIVMLEPRRVAVKAIAQFLATQLGEAVGETVGYQIRHERKVSAATRLEIVTEGVLTRRLQHDPELTDTALIIFDEFHERSIHADLALMLCYEVQQAYRDDLRLLVMSATLDSQTLSTYLDNAPIVVCAGRSFAVTESYLSLGAKPLAEQVVVGLGQLLQDVPSGDILVFLPGQGDIARAISAAEARFGQTYQLLPLHGALPLNAQTQVLQVAPDAPRRIIFATNIAETSLTIPRIAAVLDSGLEKRLVFDAKSGLSRLDTARIALSSAVQRAGRAGRLQAGHCLRLWSQAEQRTLAPYQAEELVQSELTGLVLDLAAWGISRYQEVNWLSAPPEHHFVVAKELNRTLGLIAPDGKITALGEQALTLGLAPRLAAMLLSAAEAEQAFALVLAGVLNERDLALNSASSELLERVLAVIDTLQGQRPKAAVRQAVLQQIVTTVKRLAPARQVKLQFNHSSLADYQTQLGQLLFYAFPDRVAKLSNASSRRYTMANGRGVRLRDDDAVATSEWLVVVDCDGQNRDGVIYLCQPLVDAKALIAEQLRSEVSWHLDEHKEKLIGRENSYYQQLLVASKPLPAPTAREFVRCIAPLIRSEGLTLLNWDVNCQRWLQRVAWLGQYHDAFLAVNEAGLLATLDDWLLPYLGKVDNLRALRQLPIHHLLTATLSWEQQQLLDKLAPVFYQAPSGAKVAIDYSAGVPTVSIRLQEVFGEVESPTLADGACKLRFELLSPAQRPLQTTSDLAHFWRNAYIEVAKEMRGRYPKHRWPDEPWLAAAGHSLKSRMPKTP
ncbi:ATP-dependent helicase HrpB [Pseudoalteromonas fenneropenaei]|uniref:ATP-dependent helicase HrpB n=1 Tax=Pseudoalteromonas fenneropenaei TaxID=1737459 RepID=A0ABV7CH25_9GAMM